jgi:ComF family protein
MKLGWTRRLLDAALPPHCLTCDTPVSEQGTQCPDCYARLNFITEPYCARCGLPLPYLDAVCTACEHAPPIFETARAPLLYDDGARGLILPFKHADRTDLALPMAGHMARVGASLLAHADILVPVPLHWRRLFKRRYNQSALLARRLGARAAKPVIPDALRRIRATVPLAGLSAFERRLAVEGMFIVAPGYMLRLQGKRILLIDDVMTSGATANACTRALLAAGAAAVDVLAVARVPDPRADAL